MITLAVFAFFAFAALPALAWALRLVFRVIGWSIGLVFGVLLLPLWIVCAIAGGLALALKLLIPIGLVALIVTAIAPES